MVRFESECPTCGKGDVSQWEIFQYYQEKKYRDYTEARTLKRKLNNGDWVYVSEENQLLVLSDEVARQINSSELIEEEVLNELVENKIMIKSRSER